MSASAPALGDRADELADAGIGLAQVEDLLDDRAVLALELGRLDARRLLVVVLLDLDAQAAVGAGAGRLRRRRGGGRRA